jgi:hypothetical protein
MPETRKEPTLREYFESKMQALYKQSIPYHHEVVSSLMAKYSTYGLHNKIEMRLREKAQNERRAPTQVIDDLFRKPTAEEWLKEFFS